MSIKTKALDFLTKLLQNGIKVVAGNQATLISAHLAEKITPLLIQSTEFGKIKFFCPGELPQFRARTLLTKEPETIAWIDTFNNSDILWDIGANIGIYSLYAALKGVRVLAFEPLPGNYYLLSKNIEINKVDNKVSALCMAFNDTTELDLFYMANTEMGSANNSFGEARNWQGVPFTASLKQLMIGFSIDDFIEQFNPSFPNHIKIDVDGIEDKIIKGAQETLMDKRLKSILVELGARNNDYCNKVIKIIENAGLKLQKNELLHTCFNYIFVRPKR